MSVHVCKSQYNGLEEFHLRYPGWTREEATEAACRLNGYRPALFRAAPDMLEALEDFIAAGTMDCCCGETPCCGSCTITRAQNAVKKARGE